MKKTFSIKTIVFMALLAIMAIALFSLPFARGESAFASDEESAYTYFVDGMQTDEIHLQRGCFATVTVLHNGQRYEPFLAAGSANLSLDIYRNTVALAADSVLSGSVDLYLSIETEDGLFRLARPIVLYPVLEDDYQVVQKMTGDGYVVEGDFVSACLRVMMGNASVDVTVPNGGGIADALASSGVDSFQNVEIDVLYVTLSGVDGLENEETFSVGLPTAERYVANRALGGGSGTYNDPYVVSTSYHFSIIHNYDSSSNTVYFRQSTDFTVYDDVTFSKKTFYGQYNGCGYTITRSGDITYSGFCKTNRGTIKNTNLYFTEASIIYFVMGGFVIYNYGEISDCSVETSHSPYLSDNIVLIGGGFAGIAMENKSSGTIDCCNVDMTIYVDNANNGKFDFGGIAGINRGTISDCTIAEIGIIYNYYYNHYIGGVVYSLSSNGTISDTIINGAAGYPNHPAIYIFFLNALTTTGIQPCIAAGIARNYAAPSAYSSLSTHLANSQFGVGAPNIIMVDNNFSSSDIDSTYIHPVVGENNY